MEGGVRETALFCAVRGERSPRGRAHGLGESREFQFRRETICNFFQRCHRESMEARTPGDRYIELRYEAARVAVNARGPIQSHVHQAVGLGRRKFKF